MARDEGLTLSTKPGGAAGQRNSWIDVVRGLAIFGVVAVHAGQLAHVVSNARAGSPTAGASAYGTYGVEVFFFISGWLLSNIYERDAARSLNSYGYWPKRIARIYPLWVVFLGVAIVLTLLPWLGHVLGWDLQSFARANPNLPGYATAIVMMLTFTPWLDFTLWNNVIPGGWSIQAEMASYAFFPLLRRLRLEVIIGILLAVNVATLLLIAMPFHKGSPLAWAVSAWTRLDFFSTIFYFLIGVLAARLLRGSPDLSTVAERLRTVRPFAAVLGVAYVATVLALPLWFGKNAIAIGAVAVSLVVAALIERTRAIRAFFLVIGRYSYFIYFFHVMALTVLRQAWIKFVHRPSGIFQHETVDFLLIFVLAWVVAIPLGWLSFRFIELPFMRLAARRTARRASSGRAPGSRQDEKARR